MKNHMIEETVSNLLLTLITAMPASHVRLTVGLSGGPDSVSLLLVLNNLRRTLPLVVTAAHLDHQWRPNSANDAKFCAQLCEKLGIPFFVQTATAYHHRALKNGSDEEQGRAMRRLFFKELIDTNTTDFIVLGHHRNDQHETFFIRLIRGTTLDGLTSMKEREGYYLRPLLSLDKSTLLEYLAAHDQPFLEDPTNASLDYLRNRIRHTVIPALSGCDNRFEKKLDQTMKNLQHENEFLTSLTQETFQKIFVSSDGILYGDLKAFLSLHPVVQRRIIIQWLITTNQSFSASTGLIEEITRFLASARGGRHQIGVALTVHKKQNRIWMTGKRSS